MKIILKIIVIIAMVNSIYEALFKKHKTKEINPNNYTTKKTIIISILSIVGCIVLLGLYCSLIVWLTEGNKIILILSVLMIVLTAVRLILVMSQKLMNKTEIKYYGVRTINILQVIYSLVAIPLIIG